MAKKQTAEATVKQVKKVVKTELKKGQAQVEKEIAKAKKYLEATYVKVERFVKKNPEKAAMITAALGAAVGAGLTKLLTATPAAKGKKK